MKKTDTKSAKQQNTGHTTTPAAVNPAKATEPSEATGNPDELEEVVRREVAIFKNGFPEEVLRDYRIDNYWEFEDENEDIFSGYDVKKIAAEAESVGNRVAAVDIVRQFLRFNQNDRAALDLFAAVASLKYNVTEKREEKG